MTETASTPTTSTTTDSPGTSALPADVAAALASTAAQKGIALEGIEAAPDTPPAEPTEPAAEAQPAAEPEPAKEPEKKGLSTSQLYDRIARKDAQVQQLRNELAQLKQQIKTPEAAPTKWDPSRETRLQFLERMGLTLEEVAHEALGRKAEKKDGEQKADPKLAALEAQLAELMQEREQARQQSQQQAAQAKYRQDCDAISSHLADKDFPYVTSLGAENQVLDLVTRHIGSHGSFESEQEAAETVEYYARRVESELAQRFDSVIQKPKFKDVLARKLGTSAQVEATPPRQESKGTTRSAGAAAKSTNAQPPNTNATFDREEALRLAAEEGRALLRSLSSAG